MNHSKGMGDDASQEDRQQSFIHGSKMLSMVFKAEANSSLGAAAASALAEVLDRQGLHERVSNHCYIIWYIRLTSPRGYSR